MAEAQKVLGQLNPGAATLTKLYTVPASTATVGSTYTVCNQGVDGSFRLSVRVAGAADNAKQYLHYDEPVSANRTFPGTIGMTLAATDEVWVYASHASFSFNLFGAEIS